MARVRIEPGGRVLIAAVVLSAVLFLFFKVVMTRGAKHPESQAPASTVAESTAVAVQQPAPVAAQSTESESTPSPVSQTQLPSGPIRIFFAFDHAHVNKNVYCIFDRIEHEVEAGNSQSLHIVVVGNADSIGTRSYNIKLSRMRADRVADSLSIRLGIPRNNIEIVANGFSKPIASNSTAAGRAENRRAEVYIYH